MRFSKWHALGNSYLVVDEALEPELARRLCDVRYGIGSDGVVEVVATNGATAEIVIWNPDGSVAEFSGNGSRIAAVPVKLFVRRICILKLPDAFRIPA